jgi:acid phosphatase type 7
MGDDSGGEGSVPTFRRFRSPGSGSGDPAVIPVGNAIFWYSLSIGCVHVLQLSSEHDFTIGSQQFLWIQDDLNRVDRSVTPWVVVTLHRPMMTPVAGSQFNTSVGMILNLENLFLEYGVDLVLGGHVHSYER